MRIIVPLVNADEVLPLARAGADEFYLGIGGTGGIDDTTCLNVMAIDKANFSSLALARRAITLAHGVGRKVAVCFNSESYSPQQVRAIRRMLKEIPDVDSIVACDMVLICRLCEDMPRKLVTAGTRANIMNTAAVDFYQELGAGRIVLPRHLDLRSIKQILSRRKGVPFEIFVKNEDCPFINGLCTMTHNVWNDAEGRQIFCRGSDWARTHQWRGSSDSARVRKLARAYSDRLVSGCGACVLPEIMSTGNKHIFLKLTSRLRPLQERLKDVIYFKQLITLSGQKSRRGEFQERCQRSFREVFGRSCSGNCYYACSKH